MIKNKFKVYKVFFNQISNGNATAQELPSRVLMAVGDYVNFEEWEMESGYTGRELLAKVTFIYRNRSIDNGKCFFSFKLVENIEVDKVISEISDEKTRLLIENLVHQSKIDKEFLIFVRSKLNKLFDMLAFNQRVELKTVLTAFDKKSAIELNK
jgi:hypothetical protein